MFRWIIVLTAAVLVTRTFLLPPAPAVAPPFAGLARLVAWGLAVAMVALGGLFPLPLGHRMYLSLGSGAAFATLLVFSPVEALPVAFAGMLIAQMAGRAAGERRKCAVVFNLAQYLMTWSLAAEIYHRTQAEQVYGQPVLSWVPVVAAGAVYLL
ncbi:MAG: hypothetical protein HY660_11020, partial [Armatimonadetes bacterium]|nr:hypothetical protein [Armatimonadota bacterium]